MFKTKNNQEIQGFMEACIDGKWPAGGDKH